MVKVMIITDNENIIPKVKRQKSHNDGRQPKLT